MTIISVIDSGSKRNGYILESDGQVLIMEAGCKILDYFKYLIEKGGSVVGCLASHR